jgi:hypothetical protein
VSAFDAYVQAKYHGGTIPGGPTFTVVHDAETPLTAGYCDSIVEFFRKGPAAQTSAHAMAGPEKTVKMLPDNVVAWAAGPTANTFGWHLEQAGYAAFTRDQWLTPDGQAQLRRVGACLREVHDTWGIPKRWITDDQLRAAAKGDRSQGGITTHQQISRVFPHDTTHTDPEERYPRDLLLPIVLGTTPTPAPVEDDTVKFKAFRSDPAGGGDGSIALAAPGFWYQVPDPNYWNLLLANNVCDNYSNVPGNVFGYFRALYMLPEVNDQAMADALAKLSADEAARAVTQHTP